MGECIIGFEESWSLQAIVQQQQQQQTPLMMASDFNTKSCHHHLFDDVLTFDDFVMFSNDDDDDLSDDLYKPLQQQQHHHHQQQQKQQQKQQQEQEDVVHKILLQNDDVKKGSFGDESWSVSETPIYVPKFKRRKTEHKRVVVQVRAEELCEDKWAWRKYGQKPIKGSPYPRSYYRCSSSKGCLARKQVEQSNTAAGMFIVTYTAEHNHSQPTRRNSLAGTIRNKFPSPSPALKIIEKPPTTRSNNNTEETKIKGEDIEDHHQLLLADEKRMVEKMNDNQMMDNNDNNVINNSNNEDFFAGLEDLDGLISQFSYSSEYYASQYNVF